VGRANLIGARMAPSGDKRLGKNSENIRRNQTDNAIMLSLHHYYMISISHSEGLVKPASRTFVQKLSTRNVRKDHHNVAGDKTAIRRPLSKAPVVQGDDHVVRQRIDAERAQVRLQVTQDSTWWHGNAGTGDPYVFAHPCQELDGYFDHASPIEFIFLEASAFNLPGRSSIS
jgi:hypothetical protein